MRKFIIYTIGVVLYSWSVSCNNPEKVKIATDTPTQGTIRISVDESFKPVIEEQLRVHKSSFPQTNIIVSYKPESDCFRDLQNDSTRMVIVARGLNKQEASFFENQLSYSPQYGVLAYDAVAVIVNRQSPDSIFTLSKLRSILTGKDKITAVMDGNKATSTVRYLKDSILKDAVFGANVVAAADSRNVLDIVASRKDVVGFVGISWISDSYDPVQLDYLKKIRLGLVECVKCEEKDIFAKPSQATISYGQYPLARPLYYVLKENATGLGTGFMNFMSLERGQLIFRRAFLVPAKMGFGKRSGSIKEAD
ncbi:PstS family phosphate ABC transporter substrate-binding protein [Sediminibacterium goheungense]|uniref:Phosphate ABC transporter substrate-binding protein (PhoT family) n=1 Tax=Sediminibacterium goheungense TaxID=1086393 RepID=A0A4R6IY90_9BACT|nr:substrate-binding domain-containing protein [Sediminibacterium goheungense]TDO26845.1 phosphate ABC transporter substrate-binding protein (PhoT family) [Sediminibacterium goheungense]